MDDDIREFGESELARAISHRQRARIIRGELAGGEDVVALRRFLGLSQEELAGALGIRVDTVQEWERGAGSPEGPALALLRIAARHPRVLRENLAVSA